MNNYLNINCETSDILISRKPSTELRISDISITHAHASMSGQQVVCLDKSDHNVWSSGVTTSHTILLILKTYLQSLVLH